MAEEEKSIEDWINNLISQSIELANSNYEESAVLIEQLELLPLLENRGNKVASSYISSETLYNLHRKLRDEICEEAVWSAVIWFLAHPLPIPIAHDLIDRNISLFKMALNRQFEEVQWRLATLVDDALYTLVRERYVEFQYSVKQFEIMLQMYKFSESYDGILYMLSFFQTSSPEKEAILRRMASQHEEDRNERDLAK